MSDASPTDAAKDSATVDAATDAAPVDAAKDATATDSSMNDATMSDAPADSPHEAAPPVDAPVDSPASDSSTANDSAADAADAGPGDMLAMCVLLDNNSGLMNDAGACATFTDPTNCPDRPDNWEGQFVNDFLTGPVTSDCRLTNSVFPSLLPGGDPNALGDYGNQLGGFVLDLFGCPATGDAGTFSGYELIPSGSMNHVFTSADTDLLSSYFVQTVVADFMTDQQAFGVGPAALTQPQIDAITAELARRAALLPSYHVSTAYSDPSACPADAGSDSPSSDASDAGAD